MSSEEFQPGEMVDVGSTGQYPVAPLDHAFRGCTIIKKNSSDAYQVLIPGHDEQRIPASLIRKPLEFDEHGRDKRGLPDWDERDADADAGLKPKEF
jgi:hypothetical protein